MDTGKFNVYDAFKSDKKIDHLQFVALVQGLAFTSVFYKLVINNLHVDDNTLAILMSTMETNKNISIIDFRNVDVRKKTMQSLTSSLSINNENIIQELNFIDVHLDRSILQYFIPCLQYCKLRILRLTKCDLSSKATVTLFQAMIKNEQFLTLTHLNLSRNDCGRSGTKVCFSFYYLYMRNTLFYCLIIGNCIVFEEMQCIASVGGS